MADILTRREAMGKAIDNRGYNRKWQFNVAMTNAKNALRENSDLRGSELRQAARRMVAGVGEYAPTVISRKKSNLTLAAEPEVATTSTSNSNNILDEVVVDHNPEYSSLLNHQTTAPSNDATNTTQNVDFNYVPNFGSVTTFDNWIKQPVVYIRPSQGGAELAKAAVQRGISKANIQPINDSAQEEVLSTLQYKDGDDFTSSGKFGNAFAAAKKAGLKTFMWNGKLYGTNTNPNWREKWGRVKPKDSTTVVASQPAIGSTSEPININLNGKTDNWNLSDILPKDFYNNLQSSLEAGMDKEIANQEKSDIQNTINEFKLNEFKLDLGPTMKTPGYMYYDSDLNRWTNAVDNRNKPITADNFTWTRVNKNGKVGDRFVRKGNKVGYFFAWPEKDQKIYGGSRFYTDKNGFVYTDPVVTANPKTDLDLYRKQAMARWSYILTHPSEFSAREIQYARENLPLYQKRYGR